MSLISFNWTADAAPESVKLSDALGTYGVRRADTLEVIVPDGTDMVDVGGGLFTFEFDELDNVEYECAIEIVSEGETYRILQGIGSVDSSEPPPPTTIRMLKFTLVKAGVHMDADEVPVLSAPSGNFGVATEAGEVVLVDGTTFGVLGTGQYARGFVEPDEGLRYVYYVEVIRDAVTYRLPRTTAITNGSMLAIGRYTDTYEVERVFGVDNVHLWLSVGSLDQPADYAIRAWEFLRDAEDYIDMRLRGTRYEIPFVTVYPIITQIAAVLAGVAMYEWRGAVDVNTDTNEPTHRYARYQKWALEQIKAIRNGTLKLTADEYQRFPEYVA